MESAAVDAVDLRDDDATAEPRLGRADWIAAAETLLIEDGVESVRITRLAEALSVTRGSFYWHFEDRADLLESLIGRWQRKNTAAVVAAAGQAERLDDGILGMFEAWLDPECFDPRLDSVMRDWARRSQRVRDAVVEADTARVDAFKALFERAGYAKPEAFIRARIIYFAQVGYFALVIDEPWAERQGYLEAYYEGFTGRTLDPSIAAAYRACHPDSEGGAP